MKSLPSHALPAIALPLPILFPSTGGGSSAPGGSGTEEPVRLHPGIFYKTGYRTGDRIVRTADGRRTGPSRTKALHDPSPAGQRLLPAGSSLPFGTGRNQRSQGMPVRCTAE